MRIRNDGYSTRYTAVAKPTAAGSKKPVSPIAPVSDTHAAPADQSAVLGIPEAELTPKVRAAIGQLIEEVQSLRGELERAQKRIDYLEQLADQDALTPVLNRRAFVRELSRVMSFAERYGGESAVLYFDVNGMKAINDSLGHAAGDATIAHVAEVLLANIRGSDHVGRLGGDEFGVILAQADQEEAAVKAAGLADAIQNQPVIWNGKPITVRVAYGAHIMSAGQEPKDALDAADQAMYANKRALSDTPPD